MNTNDFSKRKMPNHIAIIMDGNRRWAEARQLNYIYGHRRGAENLIRILIAARSLGIKTLTVYAFSTENRNRSKAEITALMRLFDLYLKKYTSLLREKEVKLGVIGNIAACPTFLQNRLARTCEVTAKGNKINLVLAINYGGRDEIIRAVKNIIVDYDQNKLKQKDITEKCFSRFLDTAAYSDPDLIIRTSGEFRMSNFLLWQMSYAEFYATDVLWPDFSEKDEGFKKKNSCFDSCSDCNRIIAVLCFFPYILTNYFCIGFSCTGVCCRNGVCEIGGKKTSFFK